MTEKWEYRNATRIYDESGLEVAQVSAERGLKTMRKRARLIAAAPELLEALDLIISEHDWIAAGNSSDAETIESRIGAWAETARAAIAKAKGESDEAV